MRNQDRISALPEGILLYILSLLPFKTTLRCSILSTRWRNIWKQLWAFATTLDFGVEFTSGKKSEEVVCSANQILQLHDGRLIDKFRLFFYPGKEFESDVEKWIRFAMSKGVKELELDLSQGFQRLLDADYIIGEFSDIREPCKLPGDAFNFESVSHLRLSLCNIAFPLNSDHLASLQSLYLRQVNITNDMLKSLLHNCLVLEVLTLRECSDLETAEISSPTIGLVSFAVIDCWEVERIEIDALSLKSFHFFGHLSQIVLKDVSGLVDAFVSTIDRLGNEPEDDWDFLSHLTHVEILTLCSAPLLDFKARKEYQPEDFPMAFHNLRELQLLMELDTYLEEIYDFFRLCPCPVLEKLFIEFPPSCSDGKRLQNPKQDQPDCIFDHLKIVSMKGFKGLEDQIELVRFFLERASCLKTLLLTPLKRTQHKRGVSMMEDNYTILEQTEGTRVLPCEKLALLQKASLDAEILACQSEQDFSSLPAPHAEVRRELSFYYLPEMNGQPIDEN